MYCIRLNGWKKKKNYSTDMVAHNVFDENYLIYFVSVSINFSFGLLFCNIPIDNCADQGCI